MPNYRISLDLVDIQLQLIPYDLREYRAAFTTIFVEAASADDAQREAAGCDTNWISSSPDISAGEKSMQASGDTSCDQLQCSHSSLRDEMTVEASAVNTQGSHMSAYTFTPMPVHIPTHMPMQGCRQACHEAP